MASSPKTYNPKVFHIQNPDEQDQCQFVFVPRNGEKPERCQHDGMYRIGLTIFLCGFHMPGVGRHPVSNPINVTKLEKPVVSYVPRVIGRLHKYFIDNIDQTLTYDQIQRAFPTLGTRQYISTVVSRLRRERKCHIVNILYVGYRYLGEVSE